MTKEKIGAIIALVGAALIVITLAYLAFEHNTIVGCLYIGVVLIVMGGALAAINSDI